MKKIYILFIIFITIILGIAIGIYLYIKNNNNSFASKKNAVEEINKISERIDDDCTEEWKELTDDEKSKILKTNSNEEKISPNCLIHLKKFYRKCNHITEEYIDIPKELINKTKEEFEKKYNDWKIEKFSGTEIILYREYDNECGEHFILRENDKKIIVFKINQDNKEEIYEKTNISIDYLTEKDKINIKNGIKVNGIQQLNQLIEDFE